MRRSLAKNPGNVDFCQRLAKLLMDRDRALEAFEVLERGAGACLEQGRFAGAIDLMKKMLVIRPSYAKAHIEIGQTHLQLGRFPQALESFGGAFDTFLKQGELTRCEKVLQLMQRVDSENATVVAREAELLLRRGAEEAALQRFRQAAQTLEQDGQRQEFLEIGERMLEIDPSLRDIRVKVGETLIAEARAFINYGLSEKAVAALCRAIKYTPGQVDIYHTLAGVLDESGRRTDALDILVAAAHQLESLAAKREVLLLARRLSGQGKEIDSLAAELGVDLTERAKAPQWSFSEEAPSELAAEETTPSLDDAGRFQRVITREHHPVLSAPLASENLLTLLRWIENRQSATRVVLHRRDDPQPVGEFLLHQGRVLPGVRLNGRCFDAPELHEPAGLLERWHAICQSVWERLENDAAALDPDGVLSLTERQLFSSATSRALVALAKVATRTPMKLSATELQEVPATSLSVSPAAVLMAASALLCPALEGNAPWGEERFQFGEEEWCLARCEEGRGYLPVHHRGATAPSLTEMLTAREVAERIAEHARSAWRGDDERLAVGVSVVFGDGAWGALVEGEFVFLARAEPSGIGSMLTRLDSLTGGEAA